jgi:hypothetical protein
MGGVKLYSGLAACCACFCAVAAAGQVAAPDWTVIDTERGITVSRREQPGSGIPAFRGQGTLQGNVLQMLALMIDVSAVPRWAFGIDETRALGRKDARTDYVYLYADISWPVRDRDMVVRREIVVEQQARQFLIRLHCEPDRAPLREGVVRVRSCESTFRLKTADLLHTQLDYEMTLDPAGHLPKWAGAWVAKYVPFRTLEAIERETSTTTSENRYAAAVQLWSAAL